MNHESVPAKYDPLSFRFLNDGIQNLHLLKKIAFFRIQTPGSVMNQSGISVRTIDHLNMRFHIAVQHPPPGMFLSMASSTDLRMIFDCAGR